MNWLESFVPFCLKHAVLEIAQSATSTLCLQFVTESVRETAQQISRFFPWSEWSIVTDAQPSADPSSLSPSHQNAQIPEWD